MKKLFFAIALTGMVGALSAGSIRQDDKTKKETVTATKDEKSGHCSKDNKTSGCCKKDEKATNCSKETKSCCKGKKAEEKKTETK